jgi:spermidine synthase
VPVFQEEFNRLMDIESSTVRSNQIGKPYLYLTVFTGGMVTLAVELTASRLLGSVFGTSNIVWANVIGLILLYLTVGYFIGGRLADRMPHPSAMFRIMIWAAFLSALVPLIARPVLSVAASAVLDADAALGLGSFIAVLVLFAVPITLLGTVSPFAIRLAISDARDAGRISGQIYGVSTLGSLLGTFLPTLFIIPEVGTFGTFMIFSGILFTVAWIGLLRRSRARALIWLIMPVLITLLAWLVLYGPLRAPPEGQTLLYDRESGYNYIQVTEDARGYRYLLLNEGQGIHSIYHPDIYRYNGTWDFFLAAPYFVPQTTPDEIDSLLVIGLAAGTIPRQYQHVYGDIRMTGIEIDPRIIEAGALHFDMNAELMPSLSVYAQDGRYMLNRLPDRYDVIAIDAYRPPYIPWHLTTVEYFAEVRARLTDNGVVAINVGRTPTDRRLVDALSRVLSETFVSVHAIDVPRSFNTILIATQTETDVRALEENLASLPPDVNPLLLDVLVTSVDSLVPVNLSDLVFTDDRAPVETLVDSLVINFLLSGDTDLIR